MLIASNLRCRALPFRTCASSVFGDYTRGTIGPSSDSGIQIAKPLVRLTQRAKLHAAEREALSAKPDSHHLLTAFYVLTNDAADVATTTEYILNYARDFPESEDWDFCPAIAGSQGRKTVRQSDLP
jgi:hypothetical protein